jgi:hypothetical protein
MSSPNPAAPPAQRAKQRRHLIPMMTTIMLPLEAEEDPTSPDDLRDRIAANACRNRRVLTGIQED